MVKAKIPLPRQLTDEERAIKKEMRKKIAKLVKRIEKTENEIHLIAELLSRI